MVGGPVILFLVSGAVLLVVLVALLVREARNPPRRSTAYAVARGIACDPGDVGLSFEAWALGRPGGIELAVWECGVSTPDDLTIVFVHGWGQSRIDMLTRVRPFRDHAARLVFYDLRGHGESTGPSRLGHAEEDDLVALIDRLGPGRVLLVGFSLGAVIAIHAAADGRVRDRVIGVIVHGAYTDFQSSLDGRLRSARLPARPLTTLAMAWFRLRGVRPRSVLDDAGAMACPLLVIHGEEDRIVPSDHGEAIAIAAPNATLHRADGAAHLDAHVADAAEYDRVVGEFLALTESGPVTAQR